MRVLINHGSHSLTNLGDLAMLRVCVDRVREHLPGSESLVPTTSPDDLRDHVPGATPLNLSAGSRDSSLVGLLSRIQSRALVGLLLALLAKMRWKLGRPDPILSDILDDPPDLVLQAGSGLFADPFVVSAMQRTATFAAAQDMGISTAMVSQGVGPVRNPILRRELARIMPGMKLIGSREGTFTPAMLTDLGAPPAAIRVCGDDSLELAHRARKGKLGQAIGLSVRWSNYSGFGVGRSVLKSVIRKSISEALQHVGCSLVPVTIHLDDRAATDEIAADLGQMARRWPESYTIESALEAVSMCRLVVTTSYHGAVFALGQGLPAVCLYRTEYYRRKFQGLADQFGDGCLLIGLDADLHHQRLAAALASSYRQAASNRSRLIQVAEGQIGRSRDLYRELFELVGSEDL